MQPVVTPAEMADIDAAAPEPVEVLIGRAGAATARAARSLLGGTYGRRIVVIAGKGNNGADGRDAGARLARQGARVTVVEAASGMEVPACDLVIDAAYGTGFRGSYEPPALPTPRPRVLAVDIPSGVSGLTGEASGAPWVADATVTFGALKPGLLLADGKELAGEVHLADIGLDVSGAEMHRVEPRDLLDWVPARPAESHKWKAAVWLVAGSPTMTGAAHLATRAAMRASAGYVRLSSPGVDDDPQRPTESVGWPLPAERWAGEVIDGLDRFGALVVGPGLGRSDAVTCEVRSLVSAANVPTVVDGDGLVALGADAAEVVRSRRRDAAQVVLTPHDGELLALTGEKPGPDRIAIAREVAASVNAVVLLKGSTTVVADPDGRVLFATAGDARLATAGTGDVLSGVIGALVAQGVPPFEAAAAGAWWHGTAAHLGPAVGLVASDLPELLPRAWPGSERA